MNVASLELCKELYELSGWDYYLGYYDNGDHIEIGDGSYMNRALPVCPAYDLGYLLRKLPNRIEFEDVSASWTCRWLTNTRRSGAYPYWTFNADTPEDAAAKLAIELFKQKVLTKETN